jgi:hypothetical protein
VAPSSEACGCFVLQMTGGIKECKNAGIQKNQNEPIFCWELVAGRWELFYQNEPNFPIFQQISRVIKTRIPAFLYTCFRKTNPISFNVYNFTA